jgi:hypothetical protein
MVDANNMVYQFGFCFKSFLVLHDLEFPLLHVEPSVLLAFCLFQKITTMQTVHEKLMELLRSGSRSFQGRKRVDQIAPIEQG